MVEINEAKRWFEYAQNDFEAATILSDQLKPKFEIVCYHCQQCAEKMLKGYIAFKGGRLQKVHDLVVYASIVLLMILPLQKLFPIVLISQFIHQK